MLKKKTYKTEYWFICGLGIKYSPSPEVKGRFTSLQEGFVDSRARLWLTEK